MCGAIRAEEVIPFSIRECSDTDQIEYDKHSEIQQNVRGRMCGAVCIDAYNQYVRYACGQSCWSVWVVSWWCS